ncbi:MAG: GNAT family N-acetyltransferase, partial [Chloroflexi bacterium]|nr:GNAT family N-acetyltransferase [Chloroflexota bacterium]
RRSLGSLPPGVMFRGLPGRQTAGDSPLQIVPLGAEDVSRLRRPLNSWFNLASLRDHLEQNPRLAWRVQGTDEYIVGGSWRRRNEIGSVDELAGRRHRALLLDRIIEVFRAQQRALIVLGYREQEEALPFYRYNGFDQIDEIVRYEKPNTVVSAEDPPGLEIRRFRLEDLEDVVAADHDSFTWLWWNSAAEFLWYAALPEVTIRIGVAGGRIVGYAGYTLHEREGHLDRLAVASPYQGRGFGRALLSDTLRLLGAASARRVALTTQVDNTSAQALYEQYGFRRTSIRHAIYGYWLESRPHGLPSP